MPALIITSFMLIIILFWTIFRKKRTDVFYKNIDTGSNLMTAMVALFGLFLLYSELRELREQNKFTEVAIRHSFRPLGMIDHGQEYNVFNYACDTTGRIWSFRSNKKLINKGNGVLFFVGILKFFSEREVNFNIKSLTDYIDFNKTKDALKHFQGDSLYVPSMDTLSFNAVYIDHIYNDQRLKPILPGDSLLFEIRWEPLPSRTEYYLYLVILYKDYMNRLYYTIHIEYRKFDKIMHEFAKVEKINAIEWRTNDLFFLCDYREQNEFYRAFNLINHPLAFIIGKI